MALLLYIFNGMLCTSEQQRRHRFGPIRHTGMCGDASRILSILWINGSKKLQSLWIKSSKNLSKEQLRKHSSRHVPWNVMGVGANHYLPRCFWVTHHSPGTDAYREDRSYNVVEQSSFVFILCSHDALPATCLKSCTIPRPIAVFA